MSDTTETTFSFRPKFPRGVCKTCNGPAYTGQATSCLPGGKCANAGDTVTVNRQRAVWRQLRSGTNEAKIKTTPLTDIPAAEARFERPAASPGRGATKTVKPAATDDKSKRAQELTATILNDVNPYMPVAMGYLCRPVPVENFYVATAVDEETGVPSDIQPTQLGAAAMFTAFEAKALGRCVAELETSPMLSMVSATLQPVMPIAYIVGAVGVVVFHGYRMMALRNQLLIQYRTIEQQDVAANQAGAQAADMADFIAARDGVVNATVAQPAFSEHDVA